MNRNVITVKRTEHLIDWMAGESLHAKRVQSVTNAVVGVVNAVSLSIHAIGAGLAQTSGLHAKHAIKQVDRLLSNPGFNVWELLAHWVPYVVGATQEIVVALDWTDFDADGHSTIALYLVTAHGRATPLVDPSEPRSSRLQFEAGAALQRHRARRENVSGADYSGRWQNDHSQAP
jgi:hypothetical protein